MTTGWQPEVLGVIPDPFRRACHWALYARTLVGPDGFPSAESSPGMPAEQRTAIMRLNVEIAKVRELLFPDDAP